MALSNIVAAAVGVGMLAVPLATAPNAETIRLRAVAANPSVVAALATFEDQRSRPLGNYALKWETRLLAFEHATGAP
jgi:hypothetical protein